jgi:hypothetical protein
MPMLAPARALGTSLAWLVLACLGGCSRPPGESPPAEGALAWESAAEARQRLEALWRSLDTPAPPFWSSATTPPFPGQWPPTPTTTWVHYAYAYGIDPQLADGAKIARPWARLELAAGSGRARVVLVSRKLGEIGTQGVAPLDAASLKALDTQDAVTAHCLQLRGAPPAGRPETAELVAFYRTWLRFNGVIAEAIAPSHAAFLGWLETQPR